jgi:multicomponent Na+:H+ antiporter subunit D
MIMAAMIHEGYDYLWLMLLFASAGVFHHAGIKIPYFAFFAKDSGIRTQEAPLNMLIAMSIAAVLCIFIGSHPQTLYAMLPWEVDYWPYDTTHVLSQLQLLFYSALAFVWLNKQGLYPPELHAINIDAEWLYRKLVPDTASRVYDMSQRIGSRINYSTSSSLRGISKTMSSTRIARLHLATSWPTGSMVFWIAVILGFFLLADVID